MAQGNNHGGIEEANGQWYVFYRRQTDRGSPAGSARRRYSLTARGGSDRRR